MKRRDFLGASILGSSALSDRLLVNYPGGVGDTGWLVTSEDQLIINGASSIAGELITVNIRLLQGKQWWTDSFTIDVSAGDRSAKQQVYDFSQAINQFGASSCAYPSYLADVSIEAKLATTRGQTFARANLYRRGKPLKDGQTSPIPKCSLISDYITNSVTACLRNARHFTSIEGEGNIRFITIANPGAGTNWFLNVPFNARWRIISAVWELQTDSIAGNRQSGISIKDQLGNVMWIAYAGVIGPNLTAFINVDSGGTTVAITATSPQVWFINIPENQRLPAGTQISSNSNFVGPADALISIAVQVEEWLDNV